MSWHKSITFNVHLPWNSAQWERSWTVSSVLQVWIYLPIPFWLIQPESPDEKKHILVFLLLSPSLSCALFSDWGWVSLFNPLGWEVEPKGLTKSIVLCAFRGSCPEKQCMDLFQLRKQAKISLAGRGNQMYDLCSRVSHTYLRKYSWKSGADL